MSEKCNKDDMFCRSNCSETRVQVGKIMLGFAIVIVGLAWYIVSNGILEKALN